jgi:hypothetical protein
LPNPPMPIVLDPFRFLLIADAGWMDQHQVHARTWAARRGRNQATRRTLARRRRNIERVESRIKESQTWIIASEVGAKIRSDQPTSISIILIISPGCAAGMQLHLVMVHSRRRRDCILIKTLTSVASSELDPVLEMRSQSCAPGRQLIVVVCPTGDVPIPNLDDR